jgi:hypothetical protein
MSDKTGKPTKMAADVRERKTPVPLVSDYKGFVAGIFSGIAKLSGY